VNTLKELAQALGSDPKFSTTITNSINTKAALNNPTFSGDVGGLRKEMVQLDKVDNTPDSQKPVSEATPDALDLKANKNEIYTKIEVDAT
jgi:hypothetical protein